MVSRASGGSVIRDFWSTSRVQMYEEVGDAGDTLATAQSTVTLSSPSGTAITSIAVSLHIVQINTPTMFSATTNSLVAKSGFKSTLPLNTSPFLFNASGDEVATNDDIRGTHVTSTPAAGYPLYASLPAGIYCIGISISGNELVNSANQLRFALSDDSTDVRGPDESNNNAPMILSTLNQKNYDESGGSYAITLNGVTAIPVPPTCTVTALGGAVAAYLSGRRKRTGFEIPYGLDFPALNIHLPVVPDFVKASSAGQLSEIFLSLRWLLLPRRRVAGWDRAAKSWQRSGCPRGGQCEIGDETAAGKNQKYTVAKPARRPPTWWATPRKTTPTGFWFACTWTESSRFRNQQRRCIPCRCR